MRILLVRHGESLGNVDKTVHARLPDHAIPLSEKGEEQARQAGRFICEHYKAYREPPPLIRIWTSPYERTRRTARIIQEEMYCQKVDIREHINLCEQQFGLFDGIPDDELPVRFPDEYAHYTKCEAHEGRFWARMPLGESRFDVAVRIHEAFGTFQRDADRHGINDIIVICHGVSLRAFVMQWLHLTPEWFDAEPNPGNCWIRLLEDGTDKGYVYKRNLD
ncbi:MAG: histidine phosphatase family protein [Pontiellaceae bacterium]|nr:histidine phosphatase family protein [Pontiellaceae bacterium]